jgi:hypothetical protein
MKYAEAKKIVKELGMKLSLNRDYNEYRVALPGANAESSAYYTDNLEDAIGTAKAMIQWGAK